MFKQIIMSFAFKNRITSLLFLKSKWLHLRNVQDIKLCGLYVSNSYDRTNVTILSVVKIAFSCVSLRIPPQ